MHTLVDERAAARLPPGGALIAIEIRGESDLVDRELRDAVDEDGDVFGPAEAGAGRRWLVQGRDLRNARIRLRPAVQTWRDRGYSVRVDADPIDL